MYNPGYTKWVRPYGYVPIRSFFNPVINRNSGQPHEHKREIERRRRQQARLVLKKGVPA